MAHQDAGHLGHVFQRHMAPFALLAQLSAYPYLIFCGNLHGLADLPALLF